MSGQLIAVVGPSGVGKDSVMAALVRARPTLGLVRRTITRAADAGGERFVAMTPARFAQMVAEGAFVLHWHAHGQSYGIPVSVQADLRRRDMLVNLSRGVLTQAAERFPGMAVINLDAARDVLAQRLAARGRESASEIGARLARAKRPLPAGIDALHIDNSGEISAAVATILAALYPVSA